MRIGFWITARGIENIINEVKDFEARGFASAWFANIIGVGFEALSTIAIVARETSTIELGSSVVPIYAHHPVALAQQALTVQAAAQGRLTLGIGASHPPVVEGMLGLSYKKPASRMREYLDVLLPLVADSKTSVKFEGDFYRAKCRMKVDNAQTVPVLMAALGPVMLGLAGRRANGTITWMTGPRTLESHTFPRITEAAAEAGRPAPRIVAGFPIALTNDPDNARAVSDKRFTIYGQLPSYRAMLDREGWRGPGDASLVGDEATLRAELRRLEEVGVTDLFASPFESDAGAVERTVAFLESVNRRETVV